MSDFGAFKDWALVVLGNIFIVIMLVRAIMAYTKRDWGDFATNLIVAIVVAFLVYANDAAIALIVNIGRMVFGG